MKCLNDFIVECNNNLNNLFDSNSCNALEYLQFRGITVETINYHKLGYCKPDSKISDEIKYFGDKSDLSFFLKDRIIVPVFDEFNTVVGLATRKPSFRKGETWWNLPIPFYKGKHLYLLNKSKKHVFKKNKVYLVEGYMDALYLYQSGLKNVAGIMGTALTLRKIGLIARYCDNVCLCFDSDENMAGQEATEKSICQLFKLNFCESISVMDGIPVKQDPDVYVKENGLEKFLSHEKLLTKKDIKNICLRKEQK